MLNRELVERSKHERDGFSISPPSTMLRTDFEKLRANGHFSRYAYPWKKRPCSNSSDSGFHQPLTLSLSKGATGANLTVCTFVVRQAHHERL
jgi:hypothetical protein